MKPGIFLTVIAAGLICAPPLLAQTPKPPAKPGTTPAARAASPWAKVPALPTACYQSQDQYREQNDAALDAVQNAHYAQDEINDGIRQNATDTFGNDPMAVAQRMQQAMMNDPQNARKAMEQMMQSHEQAQIEAPAQQEKEQQLEAESKTLVRQYKAALTKAQASGNARWTALKKRYGLDADANHPGESGVPDWVWAEWYVIQREWDAGYAANCAQWWSATGPIHGYLKRYKDYLVLERIPYEKEYLDKPALDHYQTIGVDATGWRTTTDYEAVEDYLKMARTLFDERATAANCTRPTDCR
jgi:hypothetical protein